MLGMRYQPQARPIIDRGNLLTSGLVSVMTGPMVEFKAAGPLGLHMARVTGGGYEDPIAARLNSPLANADAFSFVSLVRRIGLAVGTNYSMRLRNLGNSNDTRAGLGINSQGLIFTYPGGTIAVSVPVVADESIVVAGLWDKARNIAELYVNGEFAASGEVGSGTLPAGSTGIGVLHADAAGGRTNASFLPYLDLIYARTLSAREVRSLSNNAWQVFAGPDDEGDFEPAAALQRILAVEGAALEIASRQVRMAVSRRLRVQPTSLAVGSGQVAMRVARRMFVAPTALVIAPGQAGMLYSQKETPAGHTLPVSAAAIKMVAGEVRMRAARRMAVAPARIALAAGQIRALVTHRLQMSGSRLDLSGGNVTLRFVGQSAPFDVSKIHPSRVVIFGGSGSRVTPFSGSGSRVTPFEGTGSRITPFKSSSENVTEFK